MEASANTIADGRPIMGRPSASRLPDQILRLGLTALASAILILLAYFFIRLIGQSRDAFSTFGLSFVFGNNWDVAHNIYHGAALLVGTLITSTIALAIGVPVAVATALFINEACPRRLRGPFSILLDLLAAVIANEFGEASNTPIHSSALFAAGLVLFVLTLVVNIIARGFISRGGSRRGTGATGVTLAAASAGEE